ncbi:MAG: hypothetical protein JRG91_00095 [Deltaproteobacteria bacterium]|nr:hypothetical protein [Deltaproteobacteria bacterium]
MRPTRTVILAAVLAAALGSCAQNKGDCDPSCAAGLECCGGFCENLQTDPENCGACGNACVGSQICQEGVCVGASCEPPCGTGEECCTVSGGDPVCANLQIDSDHCGSCGHACPEGQSCSSGVCTSTPCDPPDCGGDPMRCCSGTCVNTDTHMDNCGFCGNACDPLEADACSGGRCQCNSAPACHSGQKCCPDLGCRNILSDVNNCGDCGVACETGLSCNDGACNCAGAECPPGYGCCTGVCKDLRYDSTNCGTCGHTCGSNGWACVDGSCVCGEDPPCDMSTCTFFLCSDLTPPGPYDACLLCCPLQGGCMPNSDTNCGTCGNSCTSGTRCEPVIGAFTCTFECVSTSTDASTDGDV